MKLHEVHWQVINNYPNSIAKNDKSSNLSFIKDTKSRDRFIKKMGLSKIKTEANNEENEETKENNEANKEENEETKENNEANKKENEEIKTSIKENTEIDIDELREYLFDKLTLHMFNKIAAPERRIESYEDIEKILNGEEKPLELQS